MSDNFQKSDSTILSSWIVHQTEIFLEELEKYIVRVHEGSSLRNLMDLCISSSRVGVDLSCFLPPLFEGQVLRMFSNILDSATESFAETIKTEPIISAAKARNPLLSLFFYISVSFLYFYTYKSLTKSGKKRIFCS